MPTKPLKTPCIGVCSTGIGDSVCRGCKRFAHEVIDWNSYSPQQKAVVDTRLGTFLSQCVSNKLRVTDKALLQWQLQVQQLTYPAHHDEYCWVYSLIKAGGSQIEKTADFGFEVDQAFRALSLVALRELIDREFFVLSQAHYERYIQTPDLFAGQAE
ncbi:MAG: DUF1289 domain-containing protein [Halioglobus sp.]|jgi:predicted Fe-S protein YdhL (DUF1289 family)|nr:DUF1289 domain-containing protein [Halioglobus sp.]